MFELGWNCFAAMDRNPLNLEFFSFQAVFVMAKIGCHRDVQRRSENCGVRASEKPRGRHITAWTTDEDGQKCVKRHSLEFLRY
eukprot:s451_g6.t1